MTELEINLILVRHGEAAHNVAARNRLKGVGREAIFTDLAFFDARLTCEGIQQAKRAAETIENAAKTREYSKDNMTDAILLVASPLRRAMETAKLIYSAASHLHVLECIREFAGVHACDSRHNRQSVKDFALNECGFEALSLDLYGDEDPLSISHPRETKEDLETRCWEFLVWLCDIAHSKQIPLTVIVVSHSAYLRCLFSLVGLYNLEQRGLKNLESRYLYIRYKQLVNYVLREAPKNLVNCTSQIERIYNSKTLNEVQSESSSIQIRHERFKFPYISEKLQFVSPNYYKISHQHLELLNVLPQIPYSLLQFPPTHSSIVVKSFTSFFDQLIKDSNKDCLPFSTTSFIDEVLIEKNNNLSYYRNRLIEDGRHVIQYLEGKQLLEIVCKEFVHNQNCLIFLLVPQDENVGFNMPKLIESLLLAAGAIGIHFLEIL